MDKQIMITYEKINSEYSNILYNDSKVGRVEVYKYSKLYIVEIDYKRYRVQFEHKQRIPLLIQSCIKARKLLSEYEKKHRDFWLSYHRKTKVKFTVKE